MRRASHLRQMHDSYAYILRSANHVQVTLLHRSHACCSTPARWLDGCEDLAENLITPFHLICMIVLLVSTISRMYLLPGCIGRLSISVDVYWHNKQPQAKGTMWVKQIFDKQQALWNRCEAASLTKLGRGTGQTPSVCFGMESRWPQEVFTTAVWLCVIADLQTCLKPCEQHRTGPLGGVRNWGVFVGIVYVHARICCALHLAGTWPR